MIEGLDDVERDVLARAILVACDVTERGRTIQLSRGDLPLLRALRDRLRLPYSAERSRTPRATEAQDEFAEVVASRFGRSCVEMQPDGVALITGLADDVEMARYRVQPNGLLA